MTKLCFALAATFALVGCTTGGGSVSPGLSVAPTTAPRYNERHYAWCARQYNTYRRSTNTYRQSGITRRRCVSPYI